MRVLITGSAGFIGYSTAFSLVKRGYDVYGIDNINNYYDVGLKHSRLVEMGIDIQKVRSSYEIVSSKFDNFKFSKVDIEDFGAMEFIFLNNSFDVVIHLAAQAGVRYSIENPKEYINSNLVGFFNILELSRKNFVKQFIYASSSSVYGNVDGKIFAETDDTDRPVSLYAATKKSNELLSHSYSSVYGLNTIGLRFFTVYGPWGRPDMAPFLFSNAICSNEEIQVFNHGNLKRDFTYIDDIVDGIISIIGATFQNNFSIFNIGNSKPIDILYFIKLLESEFNVKANLKFREMQIGDVLSTWADVSKLKSSVNYEPSVSIEEGVKRYVEWFKKYYNY
jgi:UDP-glucuronate 4-epimerase